MKLPKPSKPTAAFILVLTLGFILRATHWPTYFFGYDQVQILEQVDGIRSLDLTLVGPVTGPAALFTGPLIAYFATFLSFFVRTPYTLVALVWTTYLVNAAGILYLTKRYLKPQLALLFFSAWALSPYFASLERIPWVPTINILAAALVFLPLTKIIKTQKWQTLDITLISLGIFLGYQAHFTGLFLPMIFFFSWIIWFRGQFRMLILPILALISTLLPTAIFDLRHEFLNSKGLLTLVTTGTKSQQPVADIIGNLSHNFFITFENLGKILFQHNSSQIIVFTGVLVTGFYFLHINKRHTSKQSFRLAGFVSLWLLSIIASYALYQKNTPEYYFLVQMPALIYILATVLQRTIQKWGILLACLAVFGAYSLYLANATFAVHAGLTLGQELAAQKYIVSQIQNSSIAELVYDVHPDYARGLKYLLKDTRLSSPGSKLHIVYPYTPGHKASWLEGSLALWTDNRTKKDQNYFEFDDFILETPPGTEVFIDVSPEIGHHALKTYLVMHQGQKLGWILKYQELEFAKLASDLPTQGTWGANTLTMGDTLTSGYAQKFLKQVFFFVPNLKLEKSEFDYMYLERIRFLEL